MNFLKIYEFPKFLILTALACFFVLGTMVFSHPVLAQNSSCDDLYVGQVVVEIRSYIDGATDEQMRASLYYPTVIHAISQKKGVFTVKFERPDSFFYDKTYYYYRPVYAQYSCSSFSKYFKSFVNR
ncbi:MAG: hypothetical protein LBF22_01805 [Deltaproteobacteria bacterium]|jgi:hypothetical protein|nr:hypothetical protein [Deltaproteobacteria bacterium]